MPKESKYYSILYKDIFCSDICLKDMLYAVTVRSPIKSGSITSISLDSSIEGCELFTAKDVPGQNLINTVQGKSPVICGYNVSYEGEPVGIIVGADESTVKKALATVQISYDETPVETILSAVEQTDISDGQSDNQTVADSADDIFSLNTPERKIEHGPCFAIESGRQKGIDEVIAESPVVCKNTWSYSLSQKYYREPCGAFCNYDGKTLTIHTSSQWTATIRKALNEVLGIDEDAINVIKTKSFDRTTNSIWYNSIIACQAAIASYKTKKPVKLIYSREEQEKYIDCMKPIEFTMTTAATNEGRITAMKIEADIDLGSRNLFACEIIDRLAIASCSCYNTQNISINIKSHASHTPPLSIDMQQIDSAAFFAAESQISALAAKYNTDPNNFLILPSDIRSLNFAHAPESEDEPKQMPFSFSFPNPEDTINALVATSDYKRKYVFYNRDLIARKENDKMTVPLPSVPPARGVGFACGFEGSFYYGSNIYGSNQTLEVTLETNGSVTIHCSPVSQSVESIWIQTAAGILGLKSSDIKINSNFESGDEPVLPESVCSNISIMTVLLKRCCEALCKHKEEDELPFSVKKKFTSVQKKNWDSENFRGEPFHSCSFACATVELELDPCTYRDKIRNISIVINGGQLLNSVAAEASIKLGIQKCLSSLVADDRIDCEKIKISFMKSNEPPEQIGELVCQILPSAYIQALSQLLGTQITQIPVTQTTIYETLSKRKVVTFDLPEKVKVQDNTTTDQEEANNADRSKSEQ